MGQGNYVVAYSKVWIAGQDYAHFDIYRLKDGKIVEHWDNKEVLPDKKDLTNLGKFWWRSHQGWGSPAFLSICAFFTLPSQIMVIKSLKCLIIVL